MKIIENRFKIFAFSAILIIAGLIVMIMNQTSGKGLFNYDVEFKGGTQYVFNIGKEFNNADIEKIVTDTTGQSATVQVIGNPEDYNVQVTLLEVTPEQREALTAGIYEFYGIDDSALMNMQVISPTISSEMRNNAFMAIIVASIAMLIYVSIRFHNFHAGASAIIALVHDVSLVVLFYAVFRLPLNYSFIAVVLTILGYSINSTIVIFDRIRENKGRSHKTSDEDLMNESIKQTLTRSLYTTITTLLTVVSLYIFGVQSIRDFTLPIIFGIIVGTYSSVCLSSSVWYTLTRKTKNAK